MLAKLELYPDSLPDEMTGSVYDDLQALAAGRVVS
jgi:hypothetical protein